MTAAALSGERVKAALASLPGWTWTDDALHRSYRFADFATAIDFMHACVAEINARDHHPEWTNIYDQVTVRLRSHDAGNKVTAKDTELAKILEWQAKTFGAT